MWANCVPVLNNCITHGYILLKVSGSYLYHLFFTVNLNTEIRYSAEILVPCGFCQMKPKPEPGKIILQE